MTRFAGEKYVSVTTFRKSGVGVPTALWFAMDGDALVVWTPTASGKVKRLHNRADVTVAPCTFRGAVTGPEVAGIAEICDAAGTETVRDLVKRKYGWSGWLSVTGSILRRGRAGTIGIRITFPASAAE